MSDTATAGRGPRSLDWNALWNEASGLSTFDGMARDARQFWNRRAPSFAAHAQDKPYAGHVLSILEPRPEWSVLDVGCAAGTLAVPLASRVARVTGIDISDTMIELLQQRCASLGIANVDARRIGWEDDWSELQRHDLVIASRSLFATDLAGAIAKLQRAARRRVAIVSLVGDGPYDRKVFDAVGRSLDRGPDYLYVLNYLDSQRIYPNLRFVAEAEHPVFTDREEAVAAMRWMLDGITAEEEARLRAHVLPRLVRRSTGWAVGDPQVARWAVIWWDVEGGTDAP
jgi:SAM-dependent methyltransferase